MSREGQTEHEATQKPRFKTMNLQAPLHQPFRSLPRSHDILNDVWLPNALQDFLDWPNKQGIFLAFQPGQVVHYGVSLTRRACMNGVKVLQMPCVAVLVVPAVAMRQGIEHAQGVGLNEMLANVVLLRLDVHADYLEAGHLVAFCCTTSTAEGVEKPVL